MPEFMYVRKEKYVLRKRYQGKSLDTGRTRTPHVLSNKPALLLFLFSYSSGEVLDSPRIALAYSCLPAVKMTIWKRGNN